MLRFAITEKYFPDQNESSHEKAPQIKEKRKAILKLLIFGDDIYSAPKYVLK